MSVGHLLIVPGNLSAASSPSPTARTGGHLDRARSLSLRSAATGSLLQNGLFDEEKCVVCPLLLKTAVDASQQLSTPPNASEGQPRLAYRSHRQRWTVLGTVCLLALSNATQWIAFAPLHKEANAFYCSASGEEERANMLGRGQPSPDCDVGTWSSQIFQLVGVLTGLWGMFVTDRFGIRISCHLGSALNLCGAFVRVFSSLPGLRRPLRLPVLYAGQTLAAMAQPFFLCLSPKVAELWFREDQRALANSLSFIANPFGVSLGSIAPALFISSSSAESLGPQIFRLNVCLLGLALLVMLLCLFVTHSRPPSAPSASSECEHKPAFWSGLAILLRSPAFYVQTLTFGMAFALQWSIFVTADKYLLTVGQQQQSANPFTIGQSVNSSGPLSSLPLAPINTTSLLLSLSALSGTLASVLAGWLVDRTKWFSEFVKASYVCIAILAISICSFLHHKHHSQWDFPVLLLLFILLGFFTIPVFPISIELGVESTFPVAEATSSGILIIAGQLQLFLLTFACQFLGTLDWIYPSQSGSDNLKLSIDFWALCSVLAAAFACLFLRPRYHRLEYEQNAVFLNLLPPRFDEIGILADDKKGCWKRGRNPCSNRLVRSIPMDKKE